MEDSTKLIQSRACCTLSQGGCAESLSARISSLGTLATRNRETAMGLLIHDVSRMWRTAFDRRLKWLGVTSSQWRVLTGLANHRDRRVSQTQLAGTLDLGRGAIAAIVDCMETCGLVERLDQPSDRRMVLVSLTRKGARVLARITEVDLYVNTKVLKGVSRRAQDELASTLHDMKRTLIALGTVPDRKNAEQSGESI